MSNKASRRFSYAQKVCSIFSILFLSIKIWFTYNFYISPLSFTGLGTMYIPLLMAARNYAEILKNAKCGDSMSNCFVKSRFVSCLNNIDNFTFSDYCKYFA